MISFKIFQITLVAFALLVIIEAVVKEDKKNKKKPFNLMKGVPEELEAAGFRLVKGNGEDSDNEKSGSKAAETKKVNNNRWTEVSDSDDELSDMFAPFKTQGEEKTTENSKQNNNEGNKGSRNKNKLSDILDAEELARLGFALGEGTETTSKNKDNDNDGNKGLGNEKIYDTLGADDLAALFFGNTNRKYSENVQRKTQPIETDKDNDNDGHKGSDDNEKEAAIAAMESYMNKMKNCKKEGSPCQAGECCKALTCISYTGKEEDRKCHKEVIIFFAPPKIEDPPHKCIYTKGTQCNREEDCCMPLVCHSNSGDAKDSKCKEHKYTSNEYEVLSDTIMYEYEKPPGVCRDKDERCGPGIGKCCPGLGCWDNAVETPKCK